MKKVELRKIYKEKRLAISSLEKLKFDDLLLIQFQRLYFQQVQVLFTYWPKVAANEPNTLLFTAFMRHMVPYLQIAYPVCNVTTATMEAVLINEGTVYQTNAFGIREPKEGEILKPDIIDLVFVPLLISDKKGYRVGYGRGFYDKYLEQCRMDIIKIGFSYFDPVEKIEDADLFDVPLNYCITPQKVYEF